jgi:hypothetical protein
MEHLRDSLVMIFADVRLPGTMSGVELALFAQQKFPRLSIILTSGADAPEIPDQTVFMQKPWRALDVLRVAESVRH